MYIQVFIYVFICICMYIYISIYIYIGMLLPCLIAAVLSSGITKTYGLSVFDQGMMNRGLETFQLLLLDKHGINYIYICICIFSI
jgi:hypothetical protein